MTDDPINVLSLYWFEEKKIRLAYFSYGTIWKISLVYDENINAS